MADKNIKGITIEIGGDTTKLDKAISGTEKNTRNLQGELKKVNGLLKFDPGNAELLQQKQKLLNQTIGETKDKLNILQEAEKQVQAQFQKGDISEQQYRALQREIIKTKTDLTALEKEAKETTEQLKKPGKTAEEMEKVEKATEKVKTKMEGLADAAGKGMAAIGGAAAGAGAYSVKLEAEYTQALNQVQSQTGATKEEMVGLEQTMEDIYNNNFGENLNDVANSMAEVKKQTAETDPTKLKELTENAITLRDTFGWDVSESIRAVNQLATQFGIDAGEAFDLVVQGAQNGLDKNGNLLDTINEYGPKFEQMGLSAQDMFAMLQNGADAGVFDIDKLGDAVNEFSIRVKDGTADNAFKDLKLDVDATKTAFGQGGEAAKQAMQKTMDALAGIKDPIEQNRIGVELFGTMWEDTGGKAILAMGNMSNEIGNAKGKMEELKSVKYDDIGSQMQELGRTVQTELIKPLGEEMGPAISDVIEGIKQKIPVAKEVIGGLVDKVKEFIDFIRQNGPTIIPIVAGIAAALITWNIVTTIQAVVTAIKDFDVVTRILNSTLLKNPIALIVTAIVTLITILVAAYYKVDWFRNAVDTAFAFVKNAVSSVIDFFKNLKENITNLFNNIGEWFTQKFQAAKDGITNTFSNIGAWFQERWNDIKNVFSSIGSWFSTKFKEAYNAITNVFSGIGQFFSGIFDTIKKTFKNIGSSVGDAIGGAFKSAINAVLRTVENTVNSAIGFINGILKTADKILPGSQSFRLDEVSLPRLAKGGVLHEGDAIMAEAGPELISMVNGKAVVTPLTKTAKNTAVSEQARGGYEQNVYITSNTPLTPSEVARQTRNATRQMVLQLRKA